MRKPAPMSQRELVVLSLIVRPSPRPPKAQLIRRDAWGR
jgi:hypothetical protein